MGKRRNVKADDGQSGVKNESGKKAGRGQKRQAQEDGGQPIPRYDGSDADKLFGATVKVVNESLADQKASLASIPKTAINANRGDPWNSVLPIADKAMQGGKFN